MIGVSVLTATTFALSGIANYQTLTDEMLVALRALSATTGSAIVIVFWWRTGMVSQCYRPLQQWWVDGDWVRLGIVVSVLVIVGPPFLFVGFFDSVDSMPLPLMVWCNVAGAILLIGCLVYIGQMTWWVMKRLKPGC